jgi:hypothetical protein
MDDGTPRFFLLLPTFASVEEMLDYSASLPAAAPAVVYPGPDFMMRGSVELDPDFCGDYGNEEKLCL